MFIEGIYLEGGNKECLTITRLQERGWALRER